VNLVIESLNVFLTGQIGLEFLDVFCGLVAGCEHAEGDLDVNCFRGIDHCGVAFCCCFEGSSVRRGGDGDDFATPAELSLVSLVVEEEERKRTYTDNAPGVNAGVLLLNFFQERGNFLCSLRRSTSRLEEVAKSLSLLVGVRWVPGDVRRLALKPIRDEDLVVMAFARGSQDISSLD
jgi:hypothetical protein